MGDYSELEAHLQAFHTVAIDFWKRVPDEAWDVKTGERDKDWTLHELLAHVLSFAQVFNKAMDAALREETLTIKHMVERTDLGAWNLLEIERLTQAPPNGLIVQLSQEWRRTYENVHTMTVEDGEKLIALPYSNRPVRAIDCARWQISHAGIVHGAQAPRPLGQPPLWEAFGDDLTGAALAAFLGQWSVIYWAELGPDEPEVINFHIGGDASGGWHLVAAPDGGSMGEGIVEGAAYDLFFEHPHVFFSVFTQHLSIRKAMVAGQMRIASDIRETFDMLKLFSAKKPTLSTS